MQFSFNMNSQSKANIAYQAYACDFNAPVSFETQSSEFASFGATFQVVNNTLIVASEPWIDTTFADLGRALNSGLSAKEAFLKVIDKQSRVERFIKYANDMFEPFLEEIGCNKSTPRTIYNYICKYRDEMQAKAPVEPVKVETKEAPVEPAKKAPAKKAPAKKAAKVAKTTKSKKTKLSELPTQEVTAEESAPKAVKAKKTSKIKVVRA